MFARPSQAARWCLGVSLATLLVGAAATAGAVSLSPLRFFAGGSPFADRSPDVASLATNNRGDALVAEVVQSANGTLGAVTVRARTGARGPWSRSIRLARPAADTTDPRVAINASGAGIVAFVRNGRYVASRRRSGAWSLGSIGAPAPTTDDVSALAMTNSGRARFVHALPDAGCDPGPGSCPWTVLIYDQPAAGSLWVRDGDSLRIPATQRPVLDVSRAGHVLVAWTAPGASARLNASRRLVGDAAFEAPVAVSEPGVRGDAHAAIGDSGDAVVGWIVPDAAGSSPTFRGRVDVSLRRATNPVWANAETLVPAGAPNPDIELDIDNGGNIAAAWTTLGATAGAPTTLDASYRSAADSAWIPAPRLDSAVVTEGEALTVQAVRADGGRAFVQHVKGTGSTNDLNRLTFRSRSGVWSTRTLDGNANPTLPSSATVSLRLATAPDGDAVLAGDGLQIRNFDSSTTATAARATGLRVTVTGRSAVASFRLNTSSRVFVLRRGGAGFRTVGEYAPVTLAAGARQFRLGRLPVGRYLVGVGVCSATRGCSATPSVAFRIR